MPKQKFGKYPAVLNKQAWSIKASSYGKRALFHVGHSGQSQEGKIAPSCLLGSQPEYRFQFILHEPVQGANHHITY